MKKNKAREPISRIETYIKYGFVVIEHENYICPRCRNVLNAGPMYQPKYCDQCGQKVTFAQIVWKDEKILRYLPEKKGECI